MPVEENQGLSRVFGESQPGPASESGKISDEATKTEKATAGCFSGIGGRLKKIFRPSKRATEKLREESLSQTSHSKEEKKISFSFSNKVPNFFLSDFAKAERAEKKREYSKAVRLYKKCIYDGSKSKPEAKEKLEAIATGQGLPEPAKEAVKNARIFWAEEYRSGNRFPEDLAKCKEYADLLFTAGDVADAAYIYESLFSIKVKAEDCNGLEDICEKFLTCISSLERGEETKLMAEGFSQRFAANAMKILGEKMPVSKELEEILTNFLEQRDPVCKDFVEDYYFKKAMEGQSIKELKVLAEKGNYYALFYLGKNTEDVATSLTYFRQAVTAAEKRKTLQADMMMSDIQKKVYEKLHKFDGRELTPSEEQEKKEIYKLLGDILEEGDFAENYYKLAGLDPIERSYKTGIIYEKAGTRKHSDKDLNDAKACYESVIGQLIRKENRSDEEGKMLEQATARLARLNQPKT